MIKIQFKDQPQLEILDAKAFEQRTGVQWLDQLVFHSYFLESRARRRIARHHRYGMFDMQQKWLGIYFARLVHKPLYPALVITYINSTVGYGVRSERSLKKGEWVGEYTGIVRAREKKRDSQNFYCFEYDTGEYERAKWLIDAEKAGNYTRYINHSQTAPNLEPMQIYLEGLTHLILVAKTDIPAGTELLYDYGELYWRDRHAD